MHLKQIFAAATDFIERGVQLRSAPGIRMIHYSAGDVTYFASAPVSGSVSILLPDASTSTGQRHVVKNVGDAGSVLLTSAGGLLDNTATISAATALFSMTFVSDGANWWRIASEP